MFTLYFLTCLLVAPLAVLPCLHFLFSFVVVFSFPFRSHLTSLLPISLLNMQISALRFGRCVTGGVKHSTEFSLS